VAVIAYLFLVLATGAERVVELVISTRNAKAALANGGREFGQRHFPWMVALHTLLLLACIAEVFFADRPFIPLLGWPMLALVILSQVLRYWCISTLGSQWNTRVIVVPGLSRVTGGPYRWLSHPNYVAVVIEGFALPLVHSAWVTALAFTVLNAILLLGFRIPTENRALESLVSSRAQRPATPPAASPPASPPQAQP